ncbi:hypothetical protein KFK14_11395 [Sphingobium phenoxybenzoativorans]|uniref:Uncharacterized protein n=1 Tax=Sphingobium phenoxybenzoativorans TaxID=1592790 RepID=A0A975KAQ0_9SPHN|nr:hypothetical protein [Sphingobium phenoxybenzoativorans]QUT07934.1 hypothetical protein KFK14_11395 [Sphingobium phenoxybenzoativorans]
MAAVHPIHMPKLMSKVTLKVKVSGQRRTKLRIWIGSQILKAAAIVIGCGIEVASTLEVDSQR